ncbi:MAG: N-acetylneuraminate synthase [Lachnospiraceae bacterium]|nr:N-acetylneuraminate synthase [Lachnospiraceae bacterium]
MGVLIIAEVGINHNGDLAIAKEMVHEAKMAGADIVKFQTFVPEQELSQYTPLTDYQRKNTRDQDFQYQIDMIKKYELSTDEFRQIKEYCEKEKIMFLSTASELVSIETLNRMNPQLWKVPSNEITDYPYLKRIGQFHKPVIMSTGISTLEEIGAAMKVLKENGAGKITLLHCTSEYPAPYEEVNLQAMQTLKNEFGCEVGYSDHTPGIEISLAAVALGATVIEKHFTLDKNMSGPDHKASIDISELRQLVKSIRNIESALGDGIKRVTVSEAKNKEIMRKSIVARRNISKGEILSEKNITTKRPGNGISPMNWEKILGSVASRDYKEDEMICEV